MITIQFFENEHIEGERYLNTLQWCDEDLSQSTDSVMCYIGKTFKGEDVKVLIHD